MPSFTPKSISGKSFDWVAGHYHPQMKRFIDECNDISSEVVVLKIRERDWCLMDERLFKDGIEACNWVMRQPKSRGWAMQYQVSLTTSKHLYGIGKNDKWTGKRHPSLPEWKGDRHHWLAAM